MSVVANVRQNWSWGHPAWGIVLGVLLAISDLQLTPVDTPTGFGFVGLEVFGLMALLGMAVVAISVAAFMGLSPKVTQITIALAAILGAVAFVVAGKVGPWIYNSYDVPATRFMVLPALGLFIGLLGAGLYMRQKEPQAEIVLVAGLCALGLVPFVQESPVLWAAAAAVIATYLWIIPNLSATGRVVGMGLHFLALLGFLQLRPEWFTWTPFPFLTFAPIYVVVQYLRTEGLPREITWWTGAVISLGTAALGVSTTIGNDRKGLPVIEPLMMLAGGLLFAVVFGWFWYKGSGPHKQQVAVAV